MFVVAVACGVIALQSGAYLNNHSLCLGIDNRDFLGQNIDDVLNKYQERNFWTYYPNSYIELSDENEKDARYYSVHTDMLNPDSEYTSKYDTLSILYNEKGVIYKLELNGDEAYKGILNIIYHICK